MRMIGFEMRRLALVIFATISWSFASAATPPVFNSVRAMHDVALETSPDADFWHNIAPVYLVVDKWGNPEPNERTEVFSRWTDNYLYFLFVCPYHRLNLKPNPNTKMETNQLWNWDVAEVFIGSDFRQINHYKEFEISPQGEWIDLNINLDHPHHEDGWAWNSGFQTSAYIDRKNKIWYGAMRIPFKPISPSAVKAGDEFRINMFRTDGPPPDTKSVLWQPTFNDSFHVPQKFGTLRLVNKPN